MKELARGQRVRLADLSTEPQLELGVTVEGPDAACLRAMILCLDGAGRLVDGDEVVFHARRASRCGGVMLTPAGTFAIDLGRLDRAFERLVLALGFAGGAAAPDASGVRRGEVVVRAAGQSIARFAFLGEDFADERALCLVELYRKDPWRLAVAASGFRGGIQPMLSNYGAHGEVGQVVEQAPGTVLDATPAAHGEGAGRVQLPSAWPGGVEPSFPAGLLPAVGLIVVKTRDGQTATGTGFAITPGGHILTCAHVVEDAVEVQIALGGSRKLRPLEVVFGDRATDCAILWLSDRAGCPAWALLADPSSTPVLGDPLGILGYPLGVDLGLDVSYCEGIVNSLRTVDGCRVLQIDAGAAPGSSGAPVFSRRNGRILGLLRGGLKLQNGGMHINFAVDIRAVWAHGWFDNTI